MKNRFRTLGACLLIAIAVAGCTPQTKVEVDFDNSHQMFLESTIGRLELTDAVAGALPPGAAVCLVSMETERTSDHPMVAMVEDDLMGRLVDAGYLVVERDDDLIRRVVQESGDEGFRYMFFPGRVVVAGQTAAAYGGPTTYGVGGGFGSAVIEGTPADSVLVVPTSMAAADYIIAYRVLECGLVYRKADQRGKKKREAQVRVHLRILDTGNGAVLLARNLEARDEDLIDAGAARWLSNYHYTFFGTDYPRYRGQEWYTREVDGSRGRAENTSQNPR